jgi:hypothetical protein
MPMNERDINIAGDVGKLIQIGQVLGDVIVVSDKATRSALEKTIKSDFAKDSTDFIRVFVKSNRFGRKIEFRVPQEITANGFIDLVTDLLGLPWNTRINELMISFSFSYSVVFNNDTLSLRQTLKDAGIVDGSEVQLSIRSIWTDEIAEEDRREQARGPVMYEAGGRLQQLAAREATRSARGHMTQGRVKSLADEHFKFIDAAPRSHGDWPAE